MWEWTIYALLNWKVPYPGRLLCTRTFIFFGNLSVPDVLIKYRTFIYFELLSHLDIYWVGTLIRYSRVYIPVTSPSPKPSLSKMASTKWAQALWITPVRLIKSESNDSQYWMFASWQKILNAAILILRVQLAIRRVMLLS